MNSEEVDSLYDSMMTDIGIVKHTYKTMSNKAKAIEMIEGSRLLEKWDLQLADIIDTKELAKVFDTNNR